MKRLIVKILVLIIPSSTFCYAENNNDLPSPFTYHSVNVITGVYCESKTDLSLGDQRPLPLQRTYSSNDPTGRWQFNLPKILNTDEYASFPIAPQYANDQVTYEYDSNKRLSSVKIKDRQNKNVLHWMQINYPEENICRIETDDGEHVTYRFNPSDHTLLEASGSNCIPCTYIYSSHPVTKVKLITERKEPDGRYLLNEYYNFGPNDVGGTSVIITGNDIGKVKLQKAPLGNDGTPIVMNRFFYQDDFTEVYDALDHKVIYRHSSKYQHLTAIEHYIKDQLYRVERLHWDESHASPRLISRSFANSQGEVLMCRTFTYDAEGHIIKETLYGNLTGKNQAPLMLQSNGIPLNNGVEHYSTSYCYAEEFPKQLISQTEDNGTTTHYRYEPKINKVRAKFIQIDNEIKIRHFYTFDDNGSIIKSIVDDGHSMDPLDLSGVTERRVNDYDDKGLLLPSSSIQGEVSKAIYDINGNKCSEGDSSYIYDFSNRLIQASNVTVEGQKLSMTYHYDLAGNIVESLDAFGNTIRFEYDDIGRLISAKYPSILDENDSPYEPQEFFEYDLFNKISTHVDVKGYTTHTKYNIRGKPTQIQYPDATIQYFIYNLDGSLAESNARNGIREVYQTDFLGRVTKTEQFDANGTLMSQTSATYTSFRMQSSTDQSGLVTDYTNDKDAVIEKLPAITEEPKQSEVTPYPLIYNYNHCNSRGQNVLQTSITDASGITTTTTFDALSRIENITKSNCMGQVFSIQELRHDPLGNKIKEVYKSPNSNKTFTVCWRYGPDNKIEEIREAADSPKQRVTTYLYDAFGRLDQFIKPDGVVLHYEYDAASRVVLYSASDNSFCYQYNYDANNNVTAITDLIHNSVTTRNYNGNNQIESETLGNGLTVSISHDETGRRTGFTLPDGSEIRYKYESERLKSIERISKDGQSYYEHVYNSLDVAGRLLSAQLIDGQNSIQYAYDAKGRLTEIQSPYWSEKVCYDNSDLVTDVAIVDTEGSLSTHYLYDSQQQLISEINEKESGKNFTYDGFSNRLSQDDAYYTVNGLNQLKKMDDTSYSYDPNGCLVQKVSNDDWVAYEYDALNRLTKISNERHLIEYTYDLIGRRMSRSIVDLNEGSKKVLYFIYDGESEIGAVDSDGQIVELRILGPGKGAEIGAAIAIELKDRVYAPIHDHRGSVCCLLDAESGNSAMSYRYTAFGEVNAKCDETSVSNPWQFSSKRYEDESGLVFFGKRYYDPEIGRWITPDPLGFVDGPNRYAYVLNNPLSMQDFSGLFSFSLAWNSFANAVGSAFSKMMNAINGATSFLQQYSYSKRVEMEVENIALQLFGKTYLAISGYYVDTLDKGIYGNGEFGDHVRVTAINGILNLRADCIESVQALSLFHGGINIHYIFYPTEGWVRDMLTAFMTKGGWVSPQAKLLAQTWKQLIQEMGGIEKGGVIVHYAHSIGGTNTEIAKGMLSPEEQKMIKVITVGSATLLPNEGFASVLNYVSTYDAISFLADPIDYIVSLCDPNSNVILVPSAIWIPLIDHLFTMETYLRVVRMLGAEFVKEYGR